MDGELATLYQLGKQVGGLFDWQIDFSFLSGVRNGWYEHKPIKHILARGYWLILAPDSFCFKADFYKVIQGQLVLMDAGKIEIDFPIRTLDQRLYAPIDVRWIGIEY